MISATVLQNLEPLLAQKLPSHALRSIVRTLPPSVARPAGTLDIVEVHEVLQALNAAHRLFAPHQGFPANELRSAITVGRVTPREERIVIQSDSDVLEAQRRCQKLIKFVFGSTDCIRLGTVVSELARNIYQYAKSGLLVLRISADDRDTWLDIDAQDQGPGIPNLELVLSGKYVSRTGLGRGLVGTKAILDELTIDTAPGKGTRIRGRRKVRRA